MRTWWAVVAAMMTTSAVVCAQEEEEEESASIDLEMRTPDFDAETVRAELSAELGTPIGKPGASPRARLIVEHPTDRFRVALMQPDRSVVRNVDNIESAIDTIAHEQNTALIVTADAGTAVVKNRKLI